MFGKKGFSLKKFGSSSGENTLEKTSSFIQKKKEVKAQDQTDYNEIFQIGTNIQDDGPTHVVLNYDEEFFKSIESKIHSLNDEISENKLESVKDKIKIKVDEKVFKEGWLIKEGRINKNWKKVFFYFFNIFQEMVHFKQLFLELLHCKK
jgi:GDP-D-mannose dehydratase